MVDRPQYFCRDVDQEIRINELREAARESAGGKMISFEAAETPADISEQFWANVLAFEQAPLTTHKHQLEELGIDMPPPDGLDDEQLHARLWEVIHGLARLHVFLSSTDHLSDRELYVRLRDDLLCQLTEDLPPGSGWNCHLDILGGCSEEDLHLNLKYYADRTERAQWRRDFPEDRVPPHVDPPYDRDAKLPSGY